MAEGSDRDTEALLHTSGSPATFVDVSIRPNLQAAAEGSSAEGPRRRSAADHCLL